MTIDRLGPVAHGLPVSDVLAVLGVRADSGLSGEEAARRLETFGGNEIRSSRKVRKFGILLHQLASPVVYLLGGAAALAFAFRDWIEGVAILVVLLVNTLIGYFTETRAQKSMEALRSLGTHSARVLRGGQVRLLPARYLVPGDIVKVEAGDSISADLRLVTASNLAADESTLTGESTSVDKMPDTLREEARLADRSSMLFKGTAITRGTGMGAVVATGLNTELGRISRIVEDAAPERSPLEKSLALLAGQLVWLTLLLVSLIAGIGLVRGEDPLLMVTTAVALAVAAIPEGLPIVATLVLARGMWRMARQNALVERLSAVETLGATTLILTDKTGTLTENRMAVAEVQLPGGAVDMSGEDTIRVEDDPALRHLLEAAVLCNDAILGEREDDEIGDPMELALLREGRRAGIDRTQLLKLYPEAGRHAFDSASRMMATVHRSGAGFFYAVKGAPEAVLDSCDAVWPEQEDSRLDNTRRVEWAREIDRLGQDGLRVLAVAMKTEVDPGNPPYEGLALLGLVGLEDPPRVDVPAAIMACREAGVKVVMVTGDHAVTAHSIGRKIGLADGHEPAINGAELPSHGIENAILSGTRIFARVNPEEKLALVVAYQQAGEVVAMTGDGVNDAPALRQADIGVAMGKRGTDVAREAAAIVLLDDAFPTIVVAIREGRIIFGNIRRFAAYLLSCNLSEVILVGIAVLAGLTLPILPLQILYLNLVTDVFPAFALATGEGAEDVMRRPPRPPGDPILGRKQWRQIGFHGLLLAIATLLAMAVAGFWLGLAGDALVTVTFLTLAFSQLGHVFNMRGPSSHWLNNEVTRNPAIWAALLLCSFLLAVPPYVPQLAQLFQITPPDMATWAIILAASATPVVVVQAAGLVGVRNSPA